MKILIATDGSHFSEVAIEKCADILAMAEGTEIKIVSVYERLRPMSGEPFGVSNEYYVQAEHASRKVADDAVEQASATVRRRFPNLNIGVSTSVEPGRPARIIVETATEWEADLIVVGSHGHGFWARNMLGSVSDSVLHHAPCSVLIVRTPRVEEGS